MTAPANEPTTPPTNSPPPGEPATGKKDDGRAGGEGAILAELKGEREARQALEKQLADQAKQLEGLAPLGELAKALGVKPAQGKTDVEALTAQVTEMRQRQAEAELRAVRLEVAAEKGLTPQQAARLQGDSRTALEADADALKALFPATAGSATPGTPVPDPTQGARGGTSDLEARLAQAEKDGKTGDVIRLKTELAEQKAKARN